MMMSSMATWTIVLIGLSSFCGSLQGKVITVDKQRSAFAGGVNFEVSGDSNLGEDKLAISPSNGTNATSTGGSNTLTSPANKIIAIKKKSENLSSTGSVSKKQVIGRVGDSTGPGGEDNSQHYMLAILAMISLCYCLLCCAICVQGAVGSESMFPPLYSTTYVVNPDETLIASISQPVEGGQDNITTLDRTGQRRMMHNAGACSIAPGTAAAPIKQQAPSPEEPPAPSPEEPPAPSPKEPPAPSPKESPALSFKESPALSPKKSPALSPEESPTLMYKDFPSLSPKLKALGNTSNRVRLQSSPTSPEVIWVMGGPEGAVPLAKMNLKWKEEVAYSRSVIPVKVLPPPVASAKTPSSLERAKPQCLVATSTFKTQFDPPIDQKQKVVQKEMVQVVKIPVEKS